MPIVCKMSGVAMAIAVLSGCAVVHKAAPIAAGDRVRVHFTCRLKNGDIAISTEKDVADNASLSKSAIFIPREEQKTLVVTAGGISPEKVADDAEFLTPFEDKVTKRIAAAVVGMVPGEKRSMVLTAERHEKGAHGEENTVKLNRIMHRPKETTVPVADVTAQGGNPPIVGAVLVLGKEQLPATVMAVDTKSVSVRFSPKPGTEIETPLGKGTVRETPNDFEIVIGAPVGGLVRTGPLVGRIIDADDTSFTLDYGHPFGGEELGCDIAIEPGAEPAQQGEGRAE
jgi:FKBP-type peptidyl-prolyl cis-trans isomerase 2